MRIIGLGNLSNFLFINKKEAVLQVLSALSSRVLSKDVEGRQFDCQYFDMLNMTIKLTFKTASFEYYQFSNQAIVRTALLLVR